MNARRKGKRGELELGFPSPPQDGCPRMGNRFAERGAAFLESYE